MMLLSLLLDRSLGTVIIPEPLPDDTLGLVGLSVFKSSQEMPGRNFHDEGF